jgi:hypothetical protein
LELLPPTVSDRALLDLMGEILAVDPRPESTGALRMRFFQPGFSWQGLVDLASAHQLLAPLIWALRRRSLLLPARRSPPESDVTQRLEAAYQDHLARQEGLRDELTTILEAFNRAGIEPLLIKGARHLLIDDGGWSEARGMRDLDLVVSRDEADAAVAALAAVGFQSAPGTEVPGLHVPLMQMDGRPGAVEIHTEALAVDGRRLLAGDAVRALRERHVLGGRRFFALPVDWHTLHGLLHHQVAEHGHARHMLVIKGLWEFAMGGRALTAAQWATIAGHMKERGALDALSSWIVQASTLFGLAEPPGVTISEAARAHAAATFRRAGAPYAIRRSLFVADQLRFAFSREVLGLRYGGERSLIGAAGSHVAFLLRKYRGDTLGRLFGRKDRMS